jgi:CheY-like chemotaxis protein/LmbE family N-acetylglucosaminyl deacetylase
MTEPDTKKVQVLLVEDDLSDATLIRTLLEQEGDIRVTLAQDGIRGCLLVENQRWDLVITDFNLPGRDGIEVIQTCKAHQPDTPILATSAYAAPSFQDGAVRGGADEILVKPIEGEALLATVDSLLTLRIGQHGGSRRILAVGALPGDVEAGCGGLLLKHAQEKDETAVLVLSVGASGEEAEDRRAASQRAARLLGAHLFLPPEDSEALPNLEEMVMHVEETVENLTPHIVLAPSLHDVRESRQNAYNAVNICCSRAERFLCYQAATTTLGFRPTIFEDIAEFLDQKMATLSHYQAQIQGRPHLHPELARATARYWGRFLGYGEVEPFEVVRQQL